MLLFVSFAELTCKITAAVRQNQHAAPPCFHDPVLTQGPRTEMV